MQNQMERSFTMWEIFQEKGNTFRGIPRFSVLPELSEYHCHTSAMFLYQSSEGDWVNTQFVSETRKAPGALDTAVVPPPLRVQTKLRSLKIRFPSCIVEVCDGHLFG